MIYVDKMFYWPRKGKWCHMWADTLPELHKMAQDIDLKRSWFQKGKGHKISHYDLRESKRNLAVAAGAVEASLKEEIRKLRQLKKGADNENT